MADRFFRFILACVRCFWKKPSIHGLERIDRSQPAIFVANHLGSFGPVVLHAHLRFKLVSWVTHEVTDRRLCAAYLLHDFVEPELKLKPPLSLLAAEFIGWICVAVMEYLGVIPVYKKSRKIIATLDRSVRELERGHQLLIFPEVRNAVDDLAVNELNTGFLNVARALYQRTGTIVRFYPICVRKADNSIAVGEPIAFDPLRPFRQEKQRIIGCLEDSLRRLYGRPAEPVYGETEDDVFEEYYRSQEGIDVPDAESSLVTRGSGS